MSVFFEMFAPSRRHLEEEQNRLEWTRDEEGEGDPHRGPIDLDSGVVAIKASGQPAADAEPAAPGPHGRPEPAELSAQPSTITRQAASQIRHGEP